VVDKRWNIHKFGGSSLADAGCFRRVADIILQTDEVRMGVVVSAMGGMTDALLNLAALAEQDDSAFESELNTIGERYAATARELLHGDALIPVLDAWGKDADDVRDVLKAVALVKSAPQRSRDVIAGYGEIWSARMLAAQGVTVEQVIEATEAHARACLARRAGVPALADGARAMG